ncbi:MAG: MFS transporter, partial [Flavobacteriales bacterium]|nr:MFS transporter [Flavobacteriales bacterium]
MNTQKQQNYLAPFLTMVILFFFVGFLTCINQQFQGPIKKVFLDDPSLEGIKFTLANIIIFSWFLAYPLTGGIGSSWVAKYGYKGTLIRALGVLAVGLGIFTLSAWYEVNISSRVDIAGYNIPLAYFIFIIGSYVAGAGVTIMQVVINPYLVNCSVKGTSGIQRQNIGGSANSIGTTIAPLFVAYIIFSGATDITVDQVVWPFAGLAIAIVVVALVVSRLTLPVIPNTTETAGEKLTRSVWSFRHLTLGVIALFFYVGVEVSAGTYIVDYAKEIGGSVASKATL